MEESGTVFWVTVVLKPGPSETLDPCALQNFLFFFAFFPSLDLRWSRGYGIVAARSCLSEVDGDKKGCTNVDKPPTISTSTAAFDLRRRTPFREGNVDAQTDCWSSTTCRAHFRKTARRLCLSGRAQETLDGL